MAIVLLSAVLIIGSSLLVSEQNLLLNGGSTVSQSAAAILGTAATEIEKNATLALLGSIAQGLKNGGAVNPNLTGIDQQVDQQVANYVSTYYPMSLPASGAMPSCRNGMMDDPYVICVTSWWVHVTFPSVHGEDLYPTVAEANPSAVAGPSAQDMYLATPSASDTPYPAVVGAIDLYAYQNTSGALSQASYPFVNSPQSALGLLESSGETFSSSLDGPEAEFTRVAQYILTTVAELHALEGVGGGPYGPGTSVSSILPTSDVALAGNLALLLTTLQSFRTYDPAAVDAFHAGSSSLDTLVNKYVTNGTIDPAALFLYLLKSMGGSPINSQAQIGATLAQSVYGFVDRFTYDILATFFGKYVVDPTLLEPVATWQDIWNQGAAAVDQWAYARVTEYANDYADWFKVAICNPPIAGSGIGSNPPDENPSACTTSSINGQSATGTIGPLQSTDMVGCEVDNGYGIVYVQVPATYTMLPPTTLSVDLQTVPSMDNLLVGNEANGGYAPDPFVFNTQLAISSWYGSPPYSTSHTFSYQLVDKSLLGEYTGKGYSGYYPANYTLTAIIKDLSSSIADQSASIGISGYVDTIALDMAKMGAVGSGLPTLTPSDVLNSTYSYLTQGSANLYTTLNAAPAHLAASASQTNTWWINGAEHTSGLHQNQGPSVATSYSLADIARLGARLWYMTYYNLYYGMDGSIPGTIPGGYPIQTSNAEDGLWVSPPAHKMTVPPTSSSSSIPGLYEPNFREDIQSATYDDIYAWMSSGSGSYNGGLGNFQWFLTTTFGAGVGAVDAECSLAGGGAVISDDCDQPSTCEPFIDASAKYYLDQQNLWKHVKSLSDQAGTPTVGSGNPQFSLITTSWNNIHGTTGTVDSSTYWNDPKFTGAGGFIEHYMAGPEILPDTGNLVNQWVYGIYESSQQWTADMAGEQSLPFTPYLQRDMPYQYWQGPRSTALIDGSVQSLPNIQITSMSYYDANGKPGGLSYSVSHPQVSVHLVDPQDAYPAPLPSNMAITPFETTWNVVMAGTVKITLEDPNLELLEGGTLHPTILTLEMPVRSNFPVTVMTPWPLQSGPLQKSGPNRDPIPLETRGLLGLVVGYPATVSVDYQPLGANPADWVWLPGDYVAPYLEKLLRTLHSASIIAKNETAVEAAVLSNLPNQASDGGPALSLALSQEVQYDGAAYQSAASQVGTISALMSIIQGDLNLAAGGKLTPVLAIDYNTFFGDNMTSLNLGSQYANFQEGEGGTSLTARADVLEATDSITGTTLSGTVVYDPGNANMSLQSLWKMPGATWSLSGTWNDSGVISHLALTGPGRAISETLSANSPYLTSLLVPDQGYQAGTSTLFIGSVPSGGLGAGQSALTKAYQDWMKNTAPPFDSYVATEQYLSGYLFDCAEGALQSKLPCALPGKQWISGTALTMPGGKQWTSTALSFAPSTAITPASLGSYLLWEGSANRVLSYSLNESAPDYMALAMMAQPQVGATQADWMSNTMLPEVFWNITYGIGVFHPTPSELANPPAAYSSPDLAAVEADMGGILDGGSASAVVDLGGAQGATYTFEGSFSEW